MTNEERARKAAHQFGSVLTAIEEQRLAGTICAAIGDALAEREKDIERAVGHLRLSCDSEHPLFEMAQHVIDAITELEPKPEAR